MKKRRDVGFTLIEVMVSLFLSAMVALFVYAMMISSYNSYRRLYSVSKNANSIRYFVESFSNSIKYCDKLPEFVSGSTLTFERYDREYNRTIKEKYYFVDGSEFVKSSSYSVSLPDTTPKSATLGLLKKDICYTDDTLIETIVVSNIIRNIYFDWSAISSVDRLRKMNIGVIYDDVLDASVSKTTGKIETKADGMTEIFSDNTLNRRLFCFSFRGFDAN